MFCKNCGKQIDDNAKFCIECGTKVEKNDVDTAAQAETDLINDNIHQLISHPRKTFSAPLISHPLRKSSAQLTQQAVKAFPASLKILTIVSPLIQLIHSAQLPMKQSPKRSALLTALILQAFLMTLRL